MLAGKAGPEEAIAAAGFVACEIQIVRQMRMRFLRGDRRCDAFRRGGDDVVVANFGDRRRLAAAHAGCAKHANLIAEQAGQLLQQGLRAQHLAGQAIADADRQRRGRRLAVIDDVEVGVEGGDLINLRHRQFHGVGERHQVPGGEVAPVILQAVQEFDQKVAVARPVT